MAYSNTYTGNFTTPSGTVAAGASIAGLRDKRGAQATIVSGKLHLLPRDGYNYFQGGLIDDGSNNEINQKVRATWAPGSLAGKNLVLFTRGTEYPGRFSYYGVQLLDLYGNNQLRIIYIDKNAGGAALYGPVTPTWFNATDEFTIEFKAEGVKPTTLTVNIYNNTVNPAATVYTYSLTNNYDDIDHDFQKKGLAGVMSSSADGVDPSNPIDLSAVTIATEYVAPPPSATRITRGARTAGSNTFSTILTDGVPPYSVQFYKGVGDWAYTPGVGNTLGSPVIVATSGGTATKTDNAAGVPGTANIYKAITTDSDGKTIQSGDFLYMESLRPDPGALPTLRADVATNGLLLCTLGDSIEAPGQAILSMKAYLVSKGVNVVRMANVGFQGALWYSYVPANPTFDAQEGAVDTNTGFTYASEFGGTIPGTNAYDKACAILDKEIALAPTAVQMCAIRLGMNDLLQGITTATIISNATTVINALKTKYPNMLFTINVTSFAFRGTNGPGSLQNYNETYGAFAGYAALADNVRVFMGDTENFYFFSANYAGVGAGPLYPGGDAADYIEVGTEHVHPNNYGNGFFGGNTRTDFADISTSKFGQGPAALRGALAQQGTYAITPTNSTIAGRTTQALSVSGFTGGSVNFSVTGGAGNGTLSSASGTSTTYTAPNNAGTYTVVATGIAAPVETATYTVTVTALPLVVGSVFPSAQTTTSITLISTSPAGGTSPYTYQWYRSTTNGFTPGAGNILAGQTSLTLVDTALDPNTTYYYVLKTTDAAAGVVLSPQYLSSGAGRAAAEAAALGGQGSASRLSLAEVPRLGTRDGGAGANAGVYLPLEGYFYQNGNQLTFPNSQVAQHNGLVDTIGGTNRNAPFKKVKGLCIK